MEPIATTGDAGASAAQSEAPAPPISARLPARGIARILASIADACLPSGGAIPAGAAETDVAARILDFLAAGPGFMRLGVTLQVLFVEVSPPLLGIALRRFSSLDRPARVRVLRRLERSRIYELRTLFLGLKLFCFLMWGEHRLVARSVGSDVACVSDMLDVRPPPPEVELPA